MINQDYIPGNQMAKDEKLPPRRMDYWQPDWEFGPNGEIIKPEPKLKADVPAESVPQSEPYFQCEHCDFKTESEPGIKRHVTTKHRSN